MDTEALIAWALKTIAPLILLVIGLMILAGARAGGFAKNMVTVANVLLALVILGGGASLIAFGDELAAIAFKG